MLLIGEGIRNAEFGLRNVTCKVSVVNWRRNAEFRSAELGVRSAELGVRNWECGVRNSYWACC